MAEEDQLAELWFMDRNVYTFGCYNDFEFRLTPNARYPRVPEYAEYLRFSWPETWTSLASAFFVKIGRAHV